MTFPTSIQALLGPNTPDNEENTQCAPDWAAMRAYIIGPNPTISGANLTVQNMNTGTEVSTASTSGYLVSDPPSGFPVGLDKTPSVYLGNLLGKIGQINSSTLVETQEGPSGVDIIEGKITGITDTSGNIWVLVQGLDGQVSFSYYNVVKGADLSYWVPGVIARGNIQGDQCAGPPGTGLAYVYAGPLGSGDTQTIQIHKLNVNLTATHSIIATLVPTNIDSGWTQIYGKGICVDLVDGHLLMVVNGQSGASNPIYMIKVNSTTGAIIWKTIVPVSSISSLGSGIMMKFSVVQNSRYYIISNNGSIGLQVVIMNTNSGAVVDNYTAGVANMIDFSSTASNDNLGCVLLVCSLSGAPGGPTLRNSTPSIFQGWALLYVAAGAPFPPGSAGRKFLAELGPVKLS